MGQDEAPEVVDAEVADVAPEEAEAYKPAPGELVVADLRDEQQVFVVLDRHDEQQIIEEFQRRALRVMLYDFTKGGRRLIDLSYAGVKEAVRLMNATGKCRIAIDRDSLVVEEVTEDAGNGPEQFYVATVFAVDEVTGHGEFGTSSEPKLMRLRAGKTKWDIFARTKAINKAQRNALGHHIPEAMRQTLIAQFKGDDAAVRRIQVGAGAEKMAELPAPLTDERARAQQARARELWTQVLDAAPGGLKVGVTPALFQTYLSRAEHSHERMDDLLAFLEAKLEEARADA